jgi:hypothetical protein
VHSWASLEVVFEPLECKKTYIKQMLTKSSGTIKIWFELLKIAIQKELPVNESFYAPWGSKKEILSLTFNSWWRIRGKALFESATPKVTLLKRDEGHLLISVPTCLSASEAKRQVSALVAVSRGTKRVRQKAPLAFEGDIRYGSLVAYLRYLRIELDPKNSKKTIEQKTEILRKEYRRIQRRITKQKDTLVKAGKSKQAKKFAFRSQSTFNPLNEGRRLGFDAKKAGRWSLSAQILLLNVAEGRFPGPDYAGSRVRGNFGYKIGARLKERLEKIGLASLKETGRA